MNLKVSLLLLSVSLCNICVAASGTPHKLPEVRECGCASSSLCLPLGKAAMLYPEEPHVTVFRRKQNQPELFAFALQCDSSQWQKYDWEALTTVGVVGWETWNDQAFLCHAHSHGVRVVPLAGNYLCPEDLTNATARTEFVASQTQFLLDYGLDGVNMDFEQPLRKGSPEEQGYTEVVRELVESVHGAIPDSKVSVDLGAWFFYNLRHYDGAALAEAADLIFIMAYDAKWQGCRGPFCTAGANSHIERTRLGLQVYLDQGVPAHKLVLGLPWYGFRYICADYQQDGACRYNEAGSQLPYAKVLDMIAESGVTPAWDDYSKSPYASIQESDGSWTQLWYDDAASLRCKTDMATEMGLGGTGIWTANYLDYGASPEAERMRRLMWGAMVAGSPVTN